MGTPARAVVLAFLAAFFTLDVQTPAHSCVKRDPTPQTSPGPHDFSVAPAETKLWRKGDDGEPLFLRARVLNTCGEPVAEPANDQGG